MRVIRKAFITVFFLFLLSSCATKAERFSTNYFFVDYAGDNFANLRLTTSIKDIFIISGKICIDVDEDVRALNNRDPRGKRNIFTGKYRGQATELETRQRILDKMSYIPLEELSKKSGVKLHNSAYFSQDVRLEAGKPYTIFMRAHDAENPKFVLLSDSSSERVLGYSFVPEKGKEYQVLAQSRVEYNKKYDSFTTYYIFNVLDISKGKIHPLKNNLVRQTYSCER